MENENNVKTQSSVIRRAFFLLKRYWYVLIACILAFTAIGVLSASKKTPTYTAIETVDYTVKNVAVSNDNDASHVNAAIAYVDTVVEFAKQKCVTERANYYYSQFITSGKTVAEFLNGIKTERISRETLTFSQTANDGNVGQLYDVFYYGNSSADEMMFYSGRLLSFSDSELVFKNGGVNFKISANAFNSARKSDLYKISYTFDETVAMSKKEMKVSYYENEKLVYFTGTVDCSDENVITLKSDEKSVEVSRDNFKSAFLRFDEYVSSSNLSIGYDSEKASLVFDVGYRDKDKASVSNKVKIYVAAINDEALVMKNDPTCGIKGQYKYFKTIKINLEDLSLKTVSEQNDKNKTIFMFVIIGILAGLVVVYCVNLADRTLKDKAEVEEITGASMLAFIRKQEEK